MNARQLAERIGNIDGGLIEEAGQRPGGQRRRGGGIMRKIAAAAAVAVLMLGSGTVGALAFSRETVVEVPAEQESVRLEQIGLTLLLPESWDGKYEVDFAEDGTCTLYVKSIREKNAPEFEMGMLFYIVRWDGAMTPEQVKESELNFAAHRYLLATGDSTYVLYYASDVQWNPADEEQEAEYRKMEREIRDIRIVVDRAMTAGE